MVSASGEEFAVDIIELDRSPANREGFYENDEAALVVDAFRDEIERLHDENAF